MSPRTELQSEVTRLSSGELHDPHRLLGPHSSGDQTIVRAFHPDAVACTVAYVGGKSQARMVDERGLVEATIPLPIAQLEGYRLQFVTPVQKWEAEDPYRFLPTLSDLDLHLIGEGKHDKLWRKLGARTLTHQGVPGTAFSVWAPNARGVHLVSDVNYWDDRTHPMRSLGASGVWELFVPYAGQGTKYKYRVTKADGRQILKADPLAQQAETPPSSASIVTESHHKWRDEAWVGDRASKTWYGDPLSIYEVHLGSWRRDADGRELTYRELATQLADYCKDLGFTHIELMPVAEHPFGGSWGYQVTSYYAPTSRFGSPDDFRWFVDHMHNNGIGVILDWVPAHFPRDDWALARFDGTALYEHVDPRRGTHPEWGTLIFNYARAEVRNFLIANARYWVEEFHVDGLRADAVASMLYLDYSRGEGEWAPNHEGGNENLEAAAFLRDFNDAIHADYPGVATFAEESTAWPGVTHSTASGGLGFTFKWNMGWMNDTLEYMSKDPIYRRYHHHQLTFGLWYAWNENFILPLSHDEVVHMKRSMLNKMPGDPWQQYANLRALFGWMWAHPGKKLVFMGDEFAQQSEWSHDNSMDWHLLDVPQHSGVQQVIRDLGTRYRSIPALWEKDTSSDGFRWIDAGNADQNVLSFVRSDNHGHPGVACIANLSPVVHYDFRVGLPLAGRWEEILNTDAVHYGGSGQGNLGSVVADGPPWHGLEQSAAMVLPPLATVWLSPK
jgi:1,4-alpha-glucan branching enzyme